MTMRVAATSLCGLAMAAFAATASAQPASASMAGSLARPASIDTTAASCQPVSPAAMRASVYGVSRIRIVIDARGHVTQAEIVGSSGPTRENRLLDAVARDAFVKCPTTPALNTAGEPIGGSVEVAFPWNIGGAVASSSAPASSMPDAARLREVRSLALQPARTLSCMTIAQADASMTPPELGTAIHACLAQDRVADAAALFMLSGMALRFDFARISDRSVTGNARPLVAGVFSGATPAQKQALGELAGQWMHGEAQQSALCAEMARIGPPSYAPAYLVYAGIDALSASDPMSVVRVKDFDAQATWRALQGSYLHCAT